MKANQQIRMQMHDIEYQAVHLGILLQSVIEKIDSNVDPRDAFAAIDCYAVCALRNVELIKEHHAHVMGLIAEGGEQ